MEQARVESRSRKINAVHHDTTRQWENHRPPLEFQDMADDSLKLYQIWLNTDCVHLNDFFLLTIFHEKNTWTDLRYLKINLKCSSYNLRKWHYVSYGSIWIQVSSLWSTYSLHVAITLGSAQFEQLYVCWSCGWEVSRTLMARNTSYKSLPSGNLT